MDQANPLRRAFRAVRKAAAPSDNISSSAAEALARIRDLAELSRTPLPADAAPSFTDADAPTPMTAVPMSPAAVQLHNVMPVPSAGVSLARQPRAAAAAADLAADLVDAAAAIADAAEDDARETAFAEPVADRHPAPELHPTIVQSAHAPEESTAMTAMTAATDKAVDLHQETPITMSCLSPGLRMTGAEIDSDEDFTIHGSFDGKLKCRHLIVSANAVVRGEIAAESIRVSGLMNGLISASNLLVFKGGVIEGKVVCGSLGIQPGCTVRAEIACEPEAAFTTVANPVAASPAQPGVPAVAAAPSAEGEFSQQNFLKLVRNA